VGAGVEVLQKDQGGGKSEVFPQELYFVFGKTLTAGARDKPEDQRDHHTKNKAGCQRQIDDRVLPAKHKVAGQAAQWQVQAPSKEQSQANHHDDPAQQEQEFT
jgi:hypothetical protein